MGPKGRAVVLVALLVAAAGCAGMYGGEGEPSVTVSDQDLAEGEVTVDAAVLDEPGYVVVHADADGSPGRVIGNSGLFSGEREGVAIDVDAGNATPTVYAMLHYDDGDGEYEFPGDDGPVAVNGSVVVEGFRLTNVG